MKNNSDSKMLIGMTAAVILIIIVVVFLITVWWMAVGALIAVFIPTLVGNLYVHIAFYILTVAIVAMIGRIGTK